MHMILKVVQVESLGRVAGVHAGGKQNWGFTKNQNRRKKAKSQQKQVKIEEKITENLVKNGWEMK